jgi:NACHT/LRR/PYD domain-containing protein 1
MTSEGKNMSVSSKSHVIVPTKNMDKEEVGDSLDLLKQQRQQSGM